MRATAIRASEMPGPKTYNMWWGAPDLPPQKGIIQYSMSPMRQRAAHHMFSNWLFNGYRRLSAQVPYFAIPIGLGYGIYAWAKRYDTWQNSKAAHVAGHAHD